MLIEQRCSSVIPTSAATTVRTSRVRHAQGVCHSQRRAIAAVPQFPAIVDRAGFAAMVNKYGDWYSYNNTARAQIFRRNHTLVSNLPRMQALMRYNNFEHDPLSWCDCSPPYSAVNAIASRCDLNSATGSYSQSVFGACVCDCYPCASFQPGHPCCVAGRSNNAAIDTKVTSYNLFKEGAARIISSPTYDQQPAFVFSKSWLNSTSHVGLPDRCVVHAAECWCFGGADTKVL